jgi:hypothetical protein
MALWFRTCLIVSDGDLLTIYDEIFLIIKYYGSLFIQTYERWFMIHDQPWLPLLMIYWWLLSNNSEGINDERLIALALALSAVDKSEAL